MPTNFNKEINKKAWLRICHKRYDEAELLEWFSESDIRTYKTLANIVKDGIIIEVGSFLGGSACSIADICQKNNTKIYCIDTWKVSSLEKFGENSDQSIESDEEFFNLFLYKVINKGYLGNPIIPLRGSAFEIIDVLMASNIKANLIFLDAMHYCKQTFNLIDSYVPLLSDKGIIAGHDIKYPGVKKAVSELLPKYKTMSDNIWVNFPE